MALTAKLSSPTQSVLSQVNTTKSLALSSFCHRLKLHFLKQRLALLCPQCRPNLQRVFKMEMNLTQLLRGLCHTCKELFVNPISKPTQPSVLPTKVSVGDPKLVEIKIVSSDGIITTEFSTQPRPSITVPSKKVSTKRARARSAPSLPVRRPQDKKPQGPPTPPTTPSKKRRRTATNGGFNSASTDVLVCFEPGAVIRRTVPIKSTVFTPTFHTIEFPPRLPRTPNRLIEDSSLMDRTLTNRHARYEEVEKTMRLCRPDVLRSLYDGNSPASSSSSSTSNNLSSTESNSSNSLSSAAT